MRNSFIVHIDSLCVLDDLTNEQRGELFYAIYCFQTGREIELSPLVKIAFSQFKNQFIRDDEKYQNVVEARKQAGSKGGKQRIANQANATFAKQNQANQADSDSKSKSDSKNDKSKILDAVNSSSKLNKVSFVEWLEYKKFKYQVNSVNKLIDMLTQYDIYTQKEIIDNSIMNNYKGLFEPKKKQSASLNLYEQNKQSLQSFLNRINGQEILDSEVM